MKRDPGLRGGVPGFILVGESLPFTCFANRFKMARLLRTAVFVACFLAGGRAFASGGSCPSGSSYPENPTGDSLTTLSNIGITSCYFIAANGSDSNDGLSEASGHPWLHAPGMPNCSGNCATVYNGGNTAFPTIGFIFRGGDVWHEGNSSASPYTGGTWVQQSGTPSGCNFQVTPMNGCVYYGVDQSWYSGGSWARPIITGDNAATTGVPGSCSYQTGSNNQLVSQGEASIFDNFELTGLCSSRSSATGSDDTMIAVPGYSGTSGEGSYFHANLYIHGWSAVNGICVLIGGGNNGIQIIDHVVIDGSDSVAGSCGWGVFPSFYHMRDSYIGHTVQGVGQWCHDIHDNILEFFDANLGPGHGNLLECNVDSDGSAVYYPQNTPNVFYNNIIRHATNAFSEGGLVTLWFCPTSNPEYWFNNLEYDVGNSNFWSIATAPTYTCASSGSGSYVQYMFNNTLADGTQPCNLNSAAGGGASLYIYNEHLINSPFNGTGCNGLSDSSNVAMSDATSVTQGYATRTGQTNTQNAESITCANGTTPCTPTTGSNATVGAGHNETSAYCAALATFTSEFAIGTDAYNACKYGTTDACAYNTTSHAMSCPAQTAIVRPLSAAWDAGAYQFQAMTVPPVAPPTSLQATVH